MNATGAQLGMVGVSHRSAPTAVLETVSVPRADQPALLAALHDAGYREAVVLSTCSRTEVYAAWRVTPAAGLLEVLARYAATPVHQLREHAETRTDQAVVAHLLRVTAGLESRVLGEVEIQGQVRSAHRVAASAGLIGPTLGPLFSAALRCGQRVREETTLGAQGRSLARRAVEIGLGTLAPATAESSDDASRKPAASRTPASPRTRAAGSDPWRGPDAPVVMVVGSGRMATTAVEHLRSLGLQPRVAARDEARAEQLAGPGRVCPLPALARGIGHADLLICATSAAHHVVTVDEVRVAMATRTRPLTVVDLSVPRNVDLAVASLPGVRLVDLDGLGDHGVVDAELVSALNVGTRLVAEAARRHQEEAAARDAAPAIAALRRQVHETCLVELRRIASSDADPERIARAAHAVAGKLLHAPTMALRAAAAAGDHGAVRALCEGLGVDLPAPRSRMEDAAQVTVPRTAEPATRCSPAAMHAAVCSTAVTTSRWRT